MGPNGLLNQLTKNVLETALGAEMTEHLGYHKHDSASRGSGSGNSRSGTRSETVLTEIGPVEIDGPRRYRVLVRAADSRAVSATPEGYRRHRIGFDGKGFDDRRGVRAHGRHLPLPQARRYREAPSRPITSINLLGAHNIPPYLVTYMPLLLAAEMLGCTACAPAMLPVETSTTDL